MWGSDYMMGWGWNGGGWGWWWPMHMLFMGLLFFVVMLVVFRLVMGGRRGWRGTPGWHEREDSAHTILRERFARGEINATEFEERMKMLKGSAKPG